MVMFRRKNAAPLFAVALAAASRELPAELQAQMPAQAPESRACRYFDGQGHCEGRRLTLPAGPLTIDAGPQGGITVTGYDGDRVEVEAEVQVWGGDREQARRQAQEIVVEGQDGRVRVARAPGNVWYAVNYYVRVPRSTDLSLVTQNGGITVEDVAGSVQATAANGGIRLAGVSGQVRAGTTSGALTLERLSGDVRARTGSGAVSVTLAGERWEGRGLDAESGSGAVTVRLPRSYSARLEAGTQWGALEVDYPLPTGARAGTRVTARLGAGGAPVRAVTGSGTVALRQSANGAD